MRINKLMSNAGICSRKETNRLIEAKRITVNGKLCRLGQWVEWTDEILFDNKKVEKRADVYILLNKPKGIVCSSKPDLVNNIIDYLDYPDYVFPVGKLDKASEGLMLMTNDGELANKVLSADYEHEKEYIVSVDRAFDDLFLENLSKGVDIFGIQTRPCQVKRLDDTTFNIILSQGINRQIRKMCKKYGYNVVKLKRIRIVNLKLDAIDFDKWRHVTEEEINELRRMTKLPKEA